MKTIGFGHTPPSTPEWAVECCHHTGWQRVRRYYFAPTIGHARAFAEASGYVVFSVWQVSP